MKLRRKKNVASLHYIVDLMKQPSSTQVGRKTTEIAWLYW